MPGGYKVVVREYLQADERIVFIERGGVMTGVIDSRTGQPISIDEFGTGRGWLAATSRRRVIYGYVRPILGGAKFGGAFSFTDWKADERGVAFLNEGIGPEDICVFVPRSVTPAALHGLMHSAFRDESESETEELHEPPHQSNSDLRKHYGQHHEWHNPTVWGGKPDWRVHRCSLCGMITQQPALDSDIGVVPVIVLKPSPVGMEFETLARDDLAKVAETLEGDWSFPPGVIELELGGTITGTVTVAEGELAYITGVVGCLILNGGRAVVWRGGEISGDLIFIDGDIEIYDGTVHGAIRTDRVASLADFEEGPVSHDWMPNGLYGLPRIRLRYEAELIGGICSLDS